MALTFKERDQLRRLHEATAPPGTTPSPAAKIISDVVVNESPDKTMQALQKESLERAQYTADIKRLGPKGVIERDAQAALLKLQEKARLEGQAAVKRAQEVQTKTSVKGKPIKATTTHAVLMDAANPKQVMLPGMGSTTEPKIAGAPPEPPKVGKDTKTGELFKEGVTKEVIDAKTGKKVKMKFSKGKWALAASLVGAGIVAAITSDDEDGMPNTDAEFDSTILDGSKPFTVDQVEGSPAVATSPADVNNFNRQKIRRLTDEEAIAAGGTPGVPYYTNLTNEELAQEQAVRTGRNVVFTQTETVQAPIAQDQTPMGRIRSVQQRMNTVQETKADAIDTVYNENLAKSTAYQMHKSDLRQAIIDADNGVPGAAEEIGSIESDMARVENRARIQATNITNADPKYQSDLNLLQHEMDQAKQQLRRVSNQAEAEAAIAPEIELMVKATGRSKAEMTHLMLSPGPRKSSAAWRNAVLGPYQNGEALPAHTYLDRTSSKLNIGLMMHQAKGDRARKVEFGNILLQVYDAVSLSAPAEASAALERDGKSSKLTDKRKAAVLADMTASIYRTKYLATAQSAFSNHILAQGLSHAKSKTQLAIQQSYVNGVFDPSILRAKVPVDKRPEMIADLRQQAQAVEAYYDSTGMPGKLGMNRTMVTNRLIYIIQVLNSTQPTTETKSLIDTGGGTRTIGELGSSIFHTIGQNIVPFVGDNNDK